MRTTSTSLSSLLLSSPPVRRMCTQLEPLRRRHPRSKVVPFNNLRTGRRVWAWQLLAIFSTMWLAHVLHVVQIVDLPTNNRDHETSAFPSTFQKRQTLQSVIDSVFPVQYQGLCQRKWDRKPSPNNHPIFLWGIPSTTDEQEVERRRIIRSTYLDYFAQLQQYLGNSTLPGNSTAPSVTNRVCSIQDWTCRYEELYDKCQIIYVFFIGGNPKAPSELLDESLTDFRQMLAGPPQFVNDSSDEERKNSSSSDGEHSIDDQHRRTNEPGEVYLNIQENQFDGKMTTWFQFAALVGEEYPGIDYAAKVDSDLLLFTPTFLKYMEEEHRIATSSRTRLTERKKQRDGQSSTTGGSAVPTRRIYGGVEFPSTKCTDDGKEHDHACPFQLVGRSYMSGEMNFVSMDLAKYIASEACPRKQLTLPHEDVSLSNYVYSYVNNTKYHERERPAHRRNSLLRENGKLPITIEIISLNTSKILRTKDKAADGSNINFRTHPEKLEDYIFGHSSNLSPHPHLLWKQLDEFAGMWKLFMFYHGLSLKGPDGYTYFDTLNNRTRKIRYPGRWPGLKLDRIANTILRAKKWNDTANPLHLPEETTRKIEWSRNQPASTNNAIRKGNQSIE
jgi:hypothetical protein